MLKYIPVLRFRDQERLVLRVVTLSPKIMPLIEIVKDTPNGNLRGDFHTVHTNELGRLPMPFMVDVPVHFTLRGIDQDIRNFLAPLQNRQNRLNIFLQLTNLRNMIPVISFNPQIPYVPNSLTNEVRVLRQHFSRLAFRVFNTNFPNLSTEINSNINRNDILVLELDRLDYTDQSLRATYRAILGIKQRRNCLSVIVKSAIPSGITNNTLGSDRQVVGSNNGLLRDCTNYNFDAFGDYTGIKTNLPTGGGQISPGLIYYSWHTNEYIGFQGIMGNLPSFLNPIATSLMRSQSWLNYGPNHHQSCPGCGRILGLVASQNHSGQQTWKGITVAHYLHTMEEFL